ncbi:TetR/AcrR family transcriptional regulator [Pseudoroseomonas wenyumeiae]
MAKAAQPGLREKNRQTARDLVLDAAERLLGRGETADFSMRALAAEAGVGFATPFNHFGSKNAIMQALSSRVIARMAARFREEQPAGDALDRVLAMGRIAVQLLLEQPEVYKVVVGSLGTAGPTSSSVRPQSEALWVLALGDLDGIENGMRNVARARLPGHLAFLFRGCVSFWIAGRLKNGALGTAFDTSACIALLGISQPCRRAYLLRRITDNEAAGAAEALPPGGS